MSERIDTTEKPLTGKQRAFADAYIGEARFVGVKAAELAGYSGSFSTLAAIASQNLKKLNVRAYIDERLAALTMPANEVLARLAAIANGSVEDVLDEEGKFDFEAAKKAGKLALLKKLKRKTTYKKVDTIAGGPDEDPETLETSVVFDEVEFEMYSAHEALRDLGKHYRLFVERTEHSGPNGGPLQFGPAVDLSNLTPEELEQYETLLSKASDAA